MCDQVPRDLIGYGKCPPNPNWPNDSVIAVQFVLNFEEGGENTVINGDPASEIYLGEVSGLTPMKGIQDLSTESVFEYGSRCGVYRVLRLFKSFGYKFTVYAIGKAVENSPEIAKEFIKEGHEVASHHYRWTNYHYMEEGTERTHINNCLDAFESCLGIVPSGWYTGRNSPNGRRLLIEEYAKRNKTLLYESDAYNDDLPYWKKVGSANLLVIPYTLDCNDMKFCVSPGFTSADGYFQHLKDAFDVLYEEGEQLKNPKMMSVGMHCRLVGRPGRIQGLKRFLEYISSKPYVWVCKRVEIAEHWHQKFKPE